MTSSPIVVKLSEPVVHGEKSYDELRFTRYISGSDLVASDAVQGAMRRDYALHASLAGVPIQVFYQMRGSDIRKVREAVAPIMGEYLGISLDEDGTPPESPPNGAS